MAGVLLLVHLGDPGGYRGPIKRSLYVVQDAGQALSPDPEYLGSSCFGRVDGFIDLFGQIHPADDEHRDRLERDLCAGHQ